MAKAKTSPSADPSAAEGLSLDPMRIAPKLWDDYVAARAAARDVSRTVFFVGPGIDNKVLAAGAGSYALSGFPPDEERRLAQRDQTKAALDAQLRAHLKEDGCELWARHGSPEAPSERVLASVDELEFDHESRTAKAGSLTLYGLCERRPIDAGPAAASPQMPVEIKGRQSKRALRILLKRFGPSGLPPDADTIEKVTQDIAVDLESEAKEEAKAKGAKFDPKKVDPPKRDQVARVLRALGWNK